MSKRKGEQPIRRPKRMRERKVVNAVPVASRMRRRLITAGEIADEYHREPRSAANDNARNQFRKRLYCVPNGRDETALPCA